jgi:hypothetical protein
MMVDLLYTFAAPLDDKTLRVWHTMLLSGDKSIHVIGGYRLQIDRTCHAYAAHKCP